MMDKQRNEAFTIDGENNLDLSTNNMELSIYENQELDNIEKLEEIDEETDQDTTSIQLKD